MILRENIIELSKNLKEPKWLLEKRLAIFDSIKNHGDVLSYGLKLQVDYSDLKFDEIDFSFNGVSVTADGARVLELAGAAKDPKLAKMIQKYMFTAPEDLLENKFLGLTASAFTEGYLVILDENSPSVVDLTIAGPVENSLTYVLVVIEANQKKTILESIDALAVHGVVIDVAVKENSKLEYVGTQNLDADKTLMIARQVILEKNAEIKLLSLNLGAPRLMERASSCLNGEGAKSVIANASIGSGDQKIDLYTSSRHTAAHTISDIIVKTALAGSSQGIYRGLVKMLPNVHHSEGYQRADALLLDPGARMEAIPKLEIEHNEVKCSHGVTTSRLDKEKLFYLQSRGLSEREAKLAGVEAHLSQIIEPLEDVGLGQAVRELLKNKLEAIL